MSYVDENLGLREMVKYHARVHPVAYILPLLISICLLWPVQIIGLMTTELALTDKQMLGKTGFFRRSTARWAYGEIEGVRVTQGMLGILLDYGTLHIRSTSGNKIKFNGIAEPFDVQQQLEEAVEKAFLGRTLSRF